MVKPGVYVIFFLCSKLAYLHAQATSRLSDICYTQSEISYAYKMSLSLSGLKSTPGHRAPLQVINVTQKKKSGKLLTKQKQAINESWAVLGENSQIYLTVSLLRPFHLFLGLNFMRFCNSFSSYFTATLASLSF